MPFPRGLLRNKLLVTCARKSGRLGPSGRIQSVQNSCYEKGTMGPARNRSLCPRTGKNNHVERPRGRTEGRTMNGPTATRRANGFLISNARHPFCICALVLVPFFLSDPSSCRGQTRNLSQMKNCFSGLSLGERSVPTSFVEGFF